MYIKILEISHAKCLAVCLYSIIPPADFDIQQYSDVFFEKGKNIKGSSSSKHHLIKT